MMLRMSNNDDIVKKSDLAVDIAEKKLRAHIKCTIGLSRKELDEMLHDLSMDPFRTVQFIYSLGDRIKSPMLTDEDRNKLYLACCKVAESGFWLIRLFPDTEYRNKAFKAVLRYPMTSMTFRTDNMFINDIEKWQVTKAAIKERSNIVALIKNNDLDEKEIELLVTQILKFKDAGIAKAWYNDKYCQLPQTQKDRLLGLVMADKMVGEKL